ncbi:hypothetical protein C8A01DRAFT_46245 [Parachaetomium inaequale]|uniref:SET domain-containing protein n=1 Tax=Parachaetomium inaequale TaxID=2588326 RepID=A0AAN6PGH5_9PEZI|nr:hypothetical protein C8A01DRAFT_46245 [Parachaetomium inaequale]
MACDADGTTVYLTEQEADRIRSRVKTTIERCSVITGHARQPRDAKDAISQATGAALVADMSSMSMTKAQESLPALAVGQPYPPCIAPLHELQPMKLSDLHLETHHRGRQLFVKRASPVVTLTTKSWTMVQDDAGETERLDIVLHKTKHGKDVLESASSLIIKEPYFTLTEEGEPTLRIDHPSDLIILLPTQPQSDQHPAPEEAEKAALTHKQKGNAALAKNNLPLAHAHYTAGLALVSSHLPTPDLIRDLHRNRAHANLLLKNFDAALADALTALIHSPDPRSVELDSKSYFRAGSAAYSLGQFHDAQSFFAKQLELMPQDKGAAANLARCRARGGLKAVTYDVRDDRIRVAPVGLERAVVAKLMGNLSLISDVMGLYGDWDGGEGKDVHGTVDGPVVDAFRVHDIVSRNAFGAGGKDEQGGESAGLWIQAAYINHSCIPNTEREFIGDLMVVRATRDIAAGEEIVQSYDQSGDYEARQQALMMTWGFECGCGLCMAEKGDGAVTRERRGKLANEAAEFLKSASSGTSKRLVIMKAKRLLAAIDETYDEKKYRGLPRLASHGIQQWLVKATGRR